MTDLLTPEEDILFQRLIHSTEKNDLHKLQVVFRKYNPTIPYDCMCKMLNRKIKSKQFNEWYDQVRNR
jgi:hypothetical protein